MAVRNPSRVEAGGRHFIYAPDQDAAVSIAATLQREGWETVVHVGDEVWLVVAWCLRVLVAPLTAEVHAHLASIAAQHGAEYDGWEAESA
jgi:hypothetical protein